MRLFLALILCSTLFADENCEKLKETILQIEGLPLKIEAGKETSAVQFEVTDYAASFFKSYDFAVISVRLENGIPGSWAFYEDLIVKRVKEKKLQTKFEKRFQVPSTAQGKYELKLYIQALGKPSCYGQMNAPQEKQIDIPEHSGADLFPPTIHGSAFDKQPLKPEEKGTLSFKVQDKENSAICTGVEKENKLCTEFTSFHLELRDKESKESIQIYEPILKVGEIGYEIRFSIPKDAKPGRYHLETLNVFDLAGNGSASVSETEKKTFLDVIQ